MTAALLLVALGAALKALMDTLATHYAGSIFRGWGPWWTAEERWRWVRSHPSWLQPLLSPVSDAWHAADLVRHALWLGALVLALGLPWWALGVLWAASFGVFTVLYHYAFLRR